MLIPGPPGTDTRFLSIEQLTHDEVGEVAFYGFLDHLPGTGTANDEGIWIPDDAGVPGSQIRVRVTYRMPIITPLIQAFVDSISLVGQVVESFYDIGFPSVRVAQFIRFCRINKICRIWWRREKYGTSLRTCP